MNSSVTLFTVVSLSFFGSSCTLAARYLGSILSGSTAARVNASLRLGPEVGLGLGRRPPGIGGIGHLETMQERSEYVLTL